MHTTTLHQTARALVSPGRGILAADESQPTMTKRLDRIGVASTPEIRRRYRELLLRTPGLDHHISGVILCDETMRQHATDGTPLPQLATRAGLIPGVKVDQGTTPLAGSPGERVTEGLDGLRGRFAQYAELGARFAKWRAVLRIDHGAPSRACIHANAHALARYAALAQEAGLVPIVEPEVLMDGRHSIGRCAEATAEVLRAVYAALAEQHVALDRTLLKPNMVLPGAAAGRVEDGEIARRTIAVLRDAVPAAVPGILFLSGGQTPAEATARLNALNRCAPQPWELSFSYGRALQAPVLDAWAGREENVAAAQRALLDRARLNGEARLGRYEPAMEPAMEPALEPPAARVGAPA